MPTAMTLTSKGQFTFNKQLMEHLDVKAGERILINKMPDGSLRIEAEKNQLDIMSLAGTLKTTVQLTDEELQAAITASYIQAGLKGLK